MSSDRFPPVLSARSGRLARLRRALLVSSLFLWVIPAAGQRGPYISLDVVIYLEGQRQPYNKEVTVILRDGWGNVESGETTDRGYVQLTVTGAGTHRLIVTGTEIERYDEEFNFDTLMGRSKTILVQPRKTFAKKGPQDLVVDSARLRVPKEAEKEFERAQKAWNEKKLQDAKAHLMNALHIFPQYSDAYAALGELELLLGDRPAGRRDLETAIRLNPDHAQASRSLAEILIGEKRYVEAEPLLLVSLRKRPEDPWALSYAALSELQQKRLEDAVAMAQRVHSLPHQQYASAHMIAGRALELLNRPNDAAAEYRAYLAEAPAGDNAERARSALQRISAATQPAQEGR